MELPVLYGDRLVASISADENGARFIYHPSWIEAPDRFAVSMGIPVSNAIYGAATILPWLMNLLPEGEPLRAMSRVLGISGEDVLGLITATGHDLAGALSIAEPDRKGSAGYRPIPDQAALEKIINELPARPFLIDEDGVSMSLAGAQDKLPVHVMDNMLAVPVHGAPSTHILKPDNPRLPGSVQNEALCMVLAQSIGLDVAGVTTGKAGERSFLLVTRYDRQMHGDTLAQRIHQEDFCQALGRPPAAKYEFNGTGVRGPSVAEMIQVTRQHMTARDTNRLLDAVILNIAIGNVDSHAKNYSALLRPDGIRLAPLYDLMSGLAWDGITQNHAQAIGGQRRGRHVYGRHWLRMAHAANLSGRATLRRVQAVTARLLNALDDAVSMVKTMPAGPGLMLPDFTAAIHARISEVRSHAEDESAYGDDDETGLLATGETVPGASAYAP